MNKIIVIERHSKSSFFWPNLERKKRISELSVEQVLNKYQGFNGELITFFEIPEKITKLDLSGVINKILLNNKKNDYLIFIISDSEEDFSYLGKGIQKVGYDVGFCEEDATLYSSISNEVLFGNIEKLILYKNFLNECFLFSNRSLAEKYVHLHDELSANGEDVEDYMPMYIYTIWKVK